MTTMVTKNGLRIHEGGLNAPQNEELRERVNELIKPPAGRVMGGSYYKDLLWIGIDSIGPCNDSFAKMLLRGLGVDRLVLNGVLYQA